MGKLLVFAVLCLFAVFITVEAQTMYCQGCGCAPCWIWIGGYPAFAYSFDWYEETPSSTCTMTSCNQWCQEACEDIYPYYNGAVWTACAQWGYSDCGNGFECSVNACPNKKRGLMNVTETAGEAIFAPKEDMFSAAAPILEEVEEVAEKRDANWNDVMTPIGYIGSTPEYDDLAPAFLGCYGDNSTRDLGLYSTSGSQIQNYIGCVKFCSTKPTAFAAVQNGDECYCDNKYGMLGHSTGCTSSCSNLTNVTDTAANDTHTHCGGSWANDVWTTGYKGCWNDNGTRDLSYQLTTGDPTMTVTKCRQGCHALNYEYAGLQAGDQCFCGHHYGRLGLGQATGSNPCQQYTCAGDSSQYCGGGYKNAVFTSRESQ